MSFTNFSNLPEKVRCRIWKYAIQEHFRAIDDCLETSKSFEDIDINNVFDDPTKHVIFFRAIPMPELKDDDQRKHFVLKERPIRKYRSTKSVALTAPGHENGREKVPSWTEGHPTVFRGGTKFWQINQEALKRWNRYIKRNLAPIHGRVPPQH
ncbi:hypothetical protein PG988_001193 [Apiospora saccharicola]